MTVLSIALSSAPEETGHPAPVTAALTGPNAVLTSIRTTRKRPNTNTPFQILAAYPELNISEKTFYNYIENGIFREIAGITAPDLRRQVSRKILKKKSLKYKKRGDRKYLQGRTYKDYKEYLADNRDVFVTQMDTVYHDETNGPFIQTFKFVNAGVLFAVLHPSKTADSIEFLQIVGIIKRSG